MRRIGFTFLVFLAACSAEQRRPAPPAALPPAPAADAARGKELIERYACLACHRIPGFEEPQGSLGPDLSGIGSRPTIGGRVPNTVASMTAYLVNPPAVDPQSRMAAVGVSEDEARHITAYLTTLK